ASASAEQQASARSSVAALGAGDSAPLGSTFSAAWAPSFLRLDLTGKFGALDLGLKGQNIFRWAYDVGKSHIPEPEFMLLEERNAIALLKKDLSQATQQELIAGIVGYEENGNRQRNRRLLVQTNTSVPVQSSWNLKLQGAIGGVQGGNTNFKSISSAKFIIGRGNDKSAVKQGTNPKPDKTYASLIDFNGNEAAVNGYKTISNLRDLKNSPQFNNIFVSKTWNIGLGGSVSSTYDYGNANISQLKSLATKEAVSIDVLGRHRSITTSNWLKEEVFNFSSGFYLQQKFTNPGGSLPAYAGYTGLATGVVAAGLNIGGGTLAYKKYYGNGVNPISDNTLSNGGPGYKKTAGWLVGLNGLASALAVPLALALGSQSVKTKSSQGIQAQGRISLSRLYRGILGFDLNLADRFYSQDYYNDIGPDSSFFSKIGDQIYFDAGIRLIGGARVPLITYYKDIVIGDSSAAQSASGTPQGVTSASGTPLNVDFTADGAYPLAYLPAAGSPLFAGPPLISQDDARTFLLGDADVAALRLLTLSSAAAINTTADSLQIQVDNQGAGLNPGQYRSIRILGVPLLAGGYATVDVTVNGQGQVSGLANLQGAEYLSLPEKTPLSGAFYLPLDLFEIDPLLGRSIASPSALSAGTPTFTAPLLSLAASSNASTGLTTSRLSSFDRVAVVLGGAGYQRPQASQSGDPLTTDQPATNDNAPYTYTGIPVSLLRDQSAVSLLGHDAAHPATATVHLAGGSIRRIELDQTLYIRTDAAAADGVYSLGLILPDGINPAIAANLSLTPSSIALNNLVEESEFSAEPGAVDTGVYIAESQANQQALVSSDGYKRLQNRVAYTSLDAKGKPFTVYLNSLGRAYASSSDLTNQQIVNGTAPEFSFASHPTSISIAGTKNDLLRGDTLVVWVEAGTPLIPYSSENGNNNYQNYLTAAYGNQVLNYRMAVNGSATNWQVPLGELYRPQNAIISDLQLFNVPDPRTGTERTLLTWAEISIDAIKGLRSDFGSGLSLPATIKTTWINANPASGTIAWSDLTETVVSIPWDTETSVGMGIADLSIAAQTIKLSDGTVLQTPLISWSQSVRTPYQQAVLNDQPTIYLPMAGLAAGVNSINRGTASPSLSTTEASSRGLDFNVPGALAVEQTTAVRNVDGTGVLSTDLGSFNQLVVDLISQIPFDQLPPPPTPDPADPPLPSLPYAIECWVQLQPGSNPGGAGIVAFGQPSAAAVGSATLPQGWLLQSNFQVQRLTYAEAAALGLIETVPAGQQDGLYGWTWSLLADGANTTAMGGNGGTNLYANALSLANLGAGAKIAGVDAFLANYGLTAAQLPGLDNTTANTMAMVPTSSLLLDQFIDTATQQPTSQLNEVALDPATTLLNQGFVNAETAAANADLDIMLNRLWQYQEATGTAKVVFGLDPTPATAQAAAGPDPFSPEDYAGYALGFALSGGPSISVNGSGQIAFDVSKELTITAPAGSDQRDGAWHYVAVSYTPTYTDYTVNGTTIQVPNDHGTASLFIDGQLAASAQASNPYLPFNPNGQALLLSNNVGGAIDHVAIYSEAINALDPNPAPNGLWPKLTATDALAELEALGLPSLPGAPDPGVIPGAVT
ncbi:MAG: LamG-like jellyroll fold domain-containing protein, partial [Cyanobacteriota bacterium]